MKWFQHSTDSYNDPDISDAEDLFGDAGYSVFFKILEIYGREFNSINPDGFLNISQTFIRRKCRKSWTKVQQILNFYQTKNRIYYENDGDMVSICIPKFLDLSDNWTKRIKSDKPTKLNSDSVVTTAIEEEKEEKKKKKKKEPLIYPDFLDIPLWTEFKKYRTKIKAPLTDHAEKLCLTNLKKMMDEGSDQTDIINQTIMSGKWKGFYPVRDPTEKQEIKPTIYAQAQDAEKRQRAKWLLEEMKDDKQKDSDQRTGEDVTLLSYDKTHR